MRRPRGGSCYFFGEADNSETVLDGVELLRVELAGDDVLHHPAVLAVDVPVGHMRCWFLPRVEKPWPRGAPNLGGVLSGSL